ncbi:RimK family alpha-L-glutamate ligase [Candidatus Woesearchaeota archaeon]|nr:RimK family alpha-L-glutamate ligase [Candidatus Woesearchaeota archaeon]
MDAAIVSLGSKSSEWTYERMQEHFDSVTSLDIRKIEVNLGKDAKVLYEGKPLGNFDCIYAKGSFKYAPLLRSFTTLRVAQSYMPIKANAFTIGHNKLLTQLKLQRAGIPTPQTYISSSVEAAKKLLMNINYPIIMKFPEGTQGKGVMYADSYASASSVLDALSSLKQPFLIQEYIETGGSDIRAIVVGDKVVASMQRIAHEGEKRANIHAGGSGEPIELDSVTKKIAVKTAQAMGCDICAVDILENAKGPLVIEINLSPGLQGITQATKIDVAGHIAEYLAKKTRAFKELDTSNNKHRIMKDLGLAIDTNSEQEIIINTDMRGNRILLPELVTRICSVDDKDELVLTVSKGKIIIKKL